MWRVNRTQLLISNSNAKHNSQNQFLIVGKVFTCHHFLAHLNIRRTKQKFCSPSLHAVAVSHHSQQKAIMGDLILSFQYMHTSVYSSLSWNNLQPATAIIYVNAGFHRMRDWGTCTHNVLGIIALSFPKYCIFLYLSCFVGHVCIWIHLRESPRTIDFF